MTGCEIVAALADVVPTFKREELGIALYYRGDGDERVEAVMREGQWLWTVRDRAGRMKGWGYAETGKEAMTTALAAASVAGGGG
jgi:hypothetical protein